MDPDVIAVNIKMQTVTPLPNSGKFHILTLLLIDHLNLDPKSSKSESQLNNHISKDVLFSTLNLMIVKDDLEVNSVTTSSTSIYFHN